MSETKSKPWPFLWFGPEEAKRPGFTSDYAQGSGPFPQLPTGQQLAERWQACQTSAEREDLLRSYLLISHLTGFIQTAQITPNKGISTIPLQCALSEIERHTNVNAAHALALTFQEWNALPFGNNTMEEFNTTNKEGTVMLQAMHTFHKHANRGRALTGQKPIVLREPGDISGTSGRLIAPDDITKTKGMLWETYHSLAYKAFENYYAVQESLEKVLQDTTHQATRRWPEDYSLPQQWSANFHQQLGMLLQQPSHPTGTANLLTERRVLMTRYGKTPETAAQISAIEDQVVANAQALRTDFANNTLAPFIAEQLGGSNLRDQSSLDSFTKPQITSTRRADHLIRLKISDMKDLGHNGLQYPPPPPSTSNSWTMRAKQSLIKRTPEQELGSFSDWDQHGGLWP